MEDAGIGWIAEIVIGGIAGWLAEMFMKSNMGVILGIVGAIVANFILSLFGVVLGGLLGSMIAGFIGACNLIALAGWSGERPDHLESIRAAAYLKSTARNQRPCAAK